MRIAANAGLVLDSFAPRGVSTLCLGGEPGPLTRALDACRALEYLAGLGSIDPRRVVLQGHSHGGATVLNALDEITAEMAGLYGTLLKRSTCSRNS